MNDKVANKLANIQSNLENDGLKIAFASVVGSHNYGTTNENSDIDVKVVYWPTFEQFYNNSFTTKDVHTDELDYTTHPIHKYMHYVFKGNINFFELFFSGYFKSDYFTDEYAQDIQTLVTGNAKMVAKAQYYIALNAEKEAIKLWHDIHNVNETTVLMIDENRKKMFKCLSDALRLHVFLGDFFNTGDIHIKTNLPILTYINSVKNGLEPYEEVLAQTLEFRFMSAKHIWLDVNGDGYGTTYTENMCDMDKTDTEEYIKLKEMVGNDMFTLCQELSR